VQKRIEGDQVAGVSYILSSAQPLVNIVMLNSNSSILAIQLLGNKDCGLFYVVLYVSFNREFVFEDVLQGVAK